MKILQVSWYAVSVYLVFTVTISLFPAVISQVVSSAPTPSSSDWTSELLHSLSLTIFILSLSLSGQVSTSQLWCVS